jgi:hypothetical protein
MTSPIGANQGMTIVLDNRYFKPELIPLTEKTQPGECVLFGE